MASVVSDKRGTYFDLEGHKVRKYDFLQLSKIPRLEYDDPNVESIIANEVSFFLPRQEQYYVSTILNIIYQFRVVIFLRKKVVKN